VKELIKQLVETYGPAGQEGRVRALIEGIIRPYVDESRVDALGNLIALKRGSGGGKRLMIAAHMDEIGVVVTHIDKKGFARFGRVGGVQVQTMVGGRVLFGNGAVGVIGWEKWLQSQGVPAWEELFIDVGATSPDDSPVRVGDVGAFLRPFVDLGKRLVSKAMDDRIGCAVVIQALMEMKESPNDVYFVFTAQEELGTRGAVVSAFGVEPEVGIAVDVTHIGDTPEARPMAVSLGKGPAIKVMDAGMVVNPAVKQWMIDVAEKEGIPYQLEVLEFGGTDARSIQLSKAGVPAGCLSIPCRYVHSPSEMVDYEDVQGAVKLLRKLLESSPSFSS